MKKQTLLTKEDIARELSENEPLSIRSVERYINLARVVPAVKGSGRGKQAKFRREDVDKVVAAYKAAAEKRENQSTALTTTKPAALSRVAFVAEIVEAIEVARAASPQPPTLTDIAQKFTLSLIEASRLSGLSRGHLREAIEAKKLKAQIIGKGWRVKREELASYIRKL
jgi:excisionase family DNA binding protein